MSTRRRTGYPAVVKPALRVATTADAAAIERLMKRSARGLSTGFYDAVQTASVERYIATLDPDLIADEIGRAHV